MSNQNSPHKIVSNDTFKFSFSKKFMPVLKHAVSVHIQKIKETNPDWTLVQATALIMSDVNKQLTPPMVTELVNHIIIEWENIKTETKLQETELLEPV